MKSNYEERRQNRLQAYQNLAAKNDAKSDALYNQSEQMGAAIPMGQPILVGHHSEKGDRAYRERMSNKMGQSVEASKKAKYYEARAESLLSNTAVSSDDPNAIDKLTEKLERLEATQTLYKAINKIVKNSKLADAEKVMRLVEIGVHERRAVKMTELSQFDGAGIPSYLLTNNNANIRNTKLRIEHLSNIAAMETTEDVINGVTMKVSVEDNRVQLFFPSIPDESTRTELKRSGFRWAPSVGAWMRQISTSSVWSAKNILEKLKVD